MQNRRIWLMRALTLLLISPILLIVVVRLNHHPQAALFQSIGICLLFAQIGMIWLLRTGKL